MTDPRLQYWDSTVFVSFIRGEKEDPHRVEAVRALLDIYDRGGIQIVTSSFALAEVRALPKNDAPGPPVGREEEVERERFDPTRWQRVQDALNSEQLIIRVLTPRIARLAADIGNKFPRLLPADCVHIATAIDAEADVLFTYDGVGQRRRTADMLRYDGKIGDPPLRIREPYIPTGPLFEPTERLEP